jgi:MFS family permease
VTGVAAGGIFPVGCTLVAESLPDRARPQALGMLQACSALGNVGAGLVSLAMIELWSREIIATPWRWMFCVGIVPALLSIIAARKLREPEAWKQAVARTGKAGSFRELFGDRRWRKHAIVGLALAASGVVGLWGIGVFSNDLTQDFIGKAYDDRQRTVGEAAADLRFVARAVSSPEQLKAAAARIQPRDLLGASDKDTEAKERYETALRGLKQAGAGPNKPPQSVEPPAQPRDDTSLEEHITRIATRQKARGIRALQWAAITLAMFNVGAFFGMYAFARITHRIGRRPTFALFFVAAGVTTATAFLYMSKPSDIFWMAPLMGAAQLSLFGGYAIYFPELFPTRLRSTGTSFCYNVGRYVAASGPLGTGLLTSYVFVNADSPVQATRYAGVAMCACFLVGLAALLFAPETKDQPLPE